MTKHERFWDSNALHGPDETHVQAVGRVERRKLSAALTPPRVT